MFFHRHGGKCAIAEQDDKCDRQKPSCFRTFLFDVLDTEPDTGAFAQLTFPEFHHKYCLPTPLESFRSQDPYLCWVGGRALRVRVPARRQRRCVRCPWMRSWYLDVWSRTFGRSCLNCNHDMSKCVYINFKGDSISTYMLIHLYIYRFVTWMPFTLGVVEQRGALHSSNMQPLAR